MLDVSISCQINLSIDGELTVSNIAKAISEVEIEKIATIKAIEQIDEYLVAEYCGEKYTHGNGEERYQRAGTFTRNITTMNGELNFTLHKIRDTYK